MITWKKIKFNLRQIIAITEKNTKMAIRFKLNLIIDYISPLIALIFPFILMEALFTYQNEFGPWNKQNYFVYLLVGYIILQLQNITKYISGSFQGEKYALTLQALMIAPFNRFNLLFGYIISYILKVSISIAIFMIICYILYPISFLSFLLFLFFSLIIVIIFAGIGFLIAGFSISNENMAIVCKFIFRIALMFSCITFPFQIFPYYIQAIVNLNPLYYIIDIMRLAWIENDVITTLSSYNYHLIVLTSIGVIMPLIGIYLFNRTFKKHGIVGY